MKKAFLLILFLIAAILAYGYWHAATHSALYMSLYDRAAGDHYGRVPNAAILFSDAAGATLAAGKTEAQYGVVQVTG